MLCTYILYLLMSNVFCFGDRLSDYTSEKKKNVHAMKENLLKNSVPIKVDI